MKALQVNIQQKIFSNDVCAIQDLVFSAEQGEFLAVVGPSGAGKTSLLNIVAGLDQNIEGEILINGESHAGTQDNPERIGVMFQDARLMPWLTALENVQLVLGNNESSLEFARTLLKQVGLEEFEQAYPGQLSGGMQRRVALARAFAFQPRLLLMDEPFQSLDSPTADSLRSLLLDYWSHNGASVLYVTHNLREALMMADRILFFSSRPACIINELTIDLPRPRQLDGAEVNALYEKLLREHPQLLSGLSGSPQVSQEGHELNKKVGKWHASGIG